jgi:Holliday junction resolvasome RuvABC DNA-binding subunit
MISRLTGKIVHADTRFFVIDVNGVGYKVYTTAGVLEKTSKTPSHFGHI